MCCGQLPRLPRISDVVVIGSQAILGSYDESQLPDEAIGSIEVDVTFFDDPEAAKSDKVDGAIGELSSFHEMYQYYAQGVSISTATLPKSWENRLRTLREPELTARAGSVPRAP